MTALEQAREALISRLLAHAAIHDAHTPHDDEQRQWADDLREAAAALSAQEVPTTAQRRDELMAAGFGIGDAVRQAWASAATVEKAAPADAMSKIRGVQAFLESTWRTNSRDATDWRDDVAIAIRTLQSLLDGMAAQQAAQPVAGEPMARYERVDSCRSCRHAVGRQTCALAYRDFGHGWCFKTIPDWCPLPTTAAPAPVGLVPLTEAQLVECLVAAGCIGTVRMSYDSGPYEITRTSINADQLARAIEAKLCEVNGIKAGKDVAK